MDLLLLTPLSVLRSGPLEIKPLASLASLVTLDWLSFKSREMIGSSAPPRSADSLVTLAFLAAGGTAILSPAPHLVISRS
jgi:hypothetical protein